MKKIGIALSGGGARGIAHIGVLQALEENSISPDVVSGTSAGSIVGALYAAGKTPQEILEFAEKQSLFKLLKLRLPTRGLTELSALNKVLPKYIQEDSFEKLIKPLTIAVSNLTQGRLEFLTSGTLFDAIIASSSIPLVFKPVKRNGDLYVDGGLMCNLPAEAIREQVDFLIGVNVMPLPQVSNKRLQGMLSIANRSFEMSIKTNTIPSLAHCDVVITPESVQEYNVFNFRKVKSLYEIGYNATQEMLPELKKRLEK